MVDLAVRGRPGRKDGLMRIIGAKTLLLPSPPFPSLPVPKRGDRKQLTHCQLWTFALLFDVDDRLEECSCSTASEHRLSGSRTATTRFVPHARPA